ASQQDRRGPALLPHVAWHERGGGLLHDRVGLPRSPREAAPDGVRGRAQQADRARDGRVRGMKATRSPGWLGDLREEAGERFEEMAWPTTEDEEWRRT